MSVQSRITKALVLTAAAAAVAGCGGDDGSGPVRPEEDSVRASGPVDTVVMIDVRAAARDGELAQDYRDAALRAASATIDHGGRLSVAAFGSAADRAEPALETELPPLSESDEAQRLEAEEQARAQLALGVDAALGLSEAAPDVAQRLRQGPGSDVARAVRAGVRLVRPVVRGKRRDVRAGEERREAVVVLLSPGLNDTAELRLADELARGTDARLASELRRLIGPADGVGVVQLRGIGRTSGDDGLSPADTDRLVRIWRMACRATRARSCPVSSRI